MTLLAVASGVAVRNETELVDVDGNVLADRLGETVAGTLYSLVEYDESGLNIVYADPATMEFYRSRDHLVEHFEQVHSHAHVDFEQMELFTDALFPVADRVEYMTTAMDFMKLVRVYNDRNGLFVAIEPDEPVQPVIDAIQGLTGGFG